MQEYGTEKWVIPKHDGIRSGYTVHIHIHIVLYTDIETHTHRSTSAIGVETGKMKNGMQMNWGDSLTQVH